MGSIKVSKLDKQTRIFEADQKKKKTRIFEEIIVPPQYSVMEKIFEAKV